MPVNENARKDERARIRRTQRGSGSPGLSAGPGGPLIAGWPNQGVRRLVHVAPVVVKGDFSPAGLQGLVDGAAKNQLPERSVFKVAKRFILALKEGMQARQGKAPAFRFHTEARFLFQFFQ